MSIKRITISVPAETAKRIKRAAGDRPVSAWLSQLVEDHLEDSELEAKWQEFCESVRPRTADVRRADAIFERITKRPRRTRVA